MGNVMGLIRRDRLATRIALFSESELQKSDTNQLFEPPTPIGPQTSISFGFYTSDGSEYEVYFEPNSNLNWDVSFYLLDDEDEDAYGRPQRLIGLQDGKKSFEVMKSVVALIKKFMETYTDQVASISFSARTKEPSRVSLYRKLLNSFGLEFQESKDIWMGVSEVNFQVKNPAFTGELSETE
jgi:hypothetical protein